MPVRLLASNSQTASDLTFRLALDRFDMPTCRRERERCLGQCGGNESHVLQDFITYAAKSEVSTRVLGTERLERGRANCTTHDHIFEIPLFEGLSEAFTRYASRLRVRGGFNAIDPRACKRQPAACGAVAKVLEKDPTRAAETVVAARAAGERVAGGRVAAARAGCAPCAGKAPVQKLGDRHVQCELKQRTSLLVPRAY